MVTLEPMGPVKILVTLTNPELLQHPAFTQEETYCGNRKDAKQEANGYGFLLDGRLPATIKNQTSTKFH